MPDRRTFLKSSFAAAAAALMGTGSAEAADSSLLGSVVYTAEHPGKWTQKEGSHAPVITVEGNTVKVQTNHPMTEKHFVVRHTLVLADGVVQGSRTFNAGDPEAVSTYELPEGYTGVVIATSFCNLHDLWLTETRI
ncbi:twin-arginine translocation signal domain-containing protein [Desulfoprunum benzoelyticum]|uniref:Superoxide reductase n=1 Tax=Desulfoprunum benzoelyticum TaxID=1506996 RepID=A0A840V4Z3_9BACT|nr:desulfoferrodoxin family protein [Desulfoprunum benzoelyticum]MBB5348809.1 superoxide reductase [Desulfoprunum benzoelyticum]MBM9529972.1 twin-arginine translocation signal domain-containing protein [Desulfoprunum benzoelyticum]